MKKISCIALLMLAAALPAAAFSTSDLLSLVAMPLAVAAVADTANVPQDQLASFLATLNQADVPPTEFVQTVRYVPVALVDQQFVPYVQQQVAQGVTGSALVTVIDQRLPQYGITPQYVTVPATTLVEETDYVIQQPQYVSADPLALIAMPLAVAAVADLTNVPQDQFASLLVTLNQANVPPAQFVRVVRYVPAALTDQRFVPFVQQQVSQGVTGPALVTVIDQRLPTYTPAPAPANFPAEFAEQRGGGNPHGGPPGQIKKQLGLQTGAEVVHGVKPGRQFEQQQPAFVAQPPQPQTGPPPEHGHGRGPDGQGPPGQMKEKGGHGHGKD